MLFTDGRDSAQLIGTVDETCFSGLRDRGGASLRVMNVLPLGRDLLNGGRRELPVRALGDEEFGDVGKELRPRTCLSFA